MNIFVNAWSVEGFVSEGLQPAELGWGTHEKALPTDGSVPDLAGWRWVFTPGHTAGQTPAVLLLALRGRQAGSG